MAAAVGCGPDLSRVDGTLVVRLLGAEPELASVTLVVNHDGVVSEVEVGVEEMVVESVPAGESRVHARAGGKRSNRAAVVVFEGETTLVGLTVVDDPKADPDGDGHTSRDDNCPFAANPAQTDGDRDGLGDACDNCLSNNDPDQSDLDRDGYGDLCDPDADGDGILNIRDGCPFDATGATDDNRDGVCDSVDNCVGLDNPEQVDCDDDGRGDACDADIDEDGVGNAINLCPFSFDPAQVDSDQDGVGDACQDDPLACRKQVGG